MCGIAGILTRQDDIDLDGPLQSMMASLRHRGPDDEGSVQVTLPGGFRLGLVQTRLAIIDLSAAGHQPMTEPESGSWLVYNGEIYNYQVLRQRLGDVPFQSTSDTETLLRGWLRFGEAALESLRGMFAFALYDGQRQQLWLVRDRLGIKPLYVAQTGPETWVFASEVRALLASGLVERRLRSEAVASYLAFGACVAPWTMLAGVESVLPGECWRFDLNPQQTSPRLEKKCYWRPRFAPRGTPAPTRSEAVERLRPVLLESIALRMVADVPVGVFLSGGIDSSSVVAGLASRGFQPRSFSVIFGERQYDESSHSRAIARHFGTDHTELMLGPREVLADLEQAMAAYDQPSIDGVNTYFISRATRQAGVKVALSGIGGDELFAGYSYFRRMARWEQPGARLLARLAYGVLRLLAPAGTRTSKLSALLHANGSRLASYAINRQVLAPKRSRALVPAAASTGSVIPEALQRQLEREVADLDAVNAHSCLEISLYLANMLLRDMDQMSMAHSLELREPLLDHVLVETAAALPGGLKLAGGKPRCNKALLVEALPGGLPESVTRRAKMGFVFPWERWLRQELRDLVESVLRDSEAVLAAGLDREAVGRLWSDYLANRPGVRYSDVLCVLNLVYWVRHNKLTVDEVMFACAR